MWKQIYPRMIKLVLGIVGISVGNPIFLALLTEPRGLSKANAIPGVYYVLLWSPLLVNPQKPEIMIGLRSFGVTK